MKLVSLLISSVLAAATVATPVHCANTTNSTVGPENGNLVIVGGNLQSDSIWGKIIELAGGKDAPIGMARAVSTPNPCL